MASRSTGRPSGPRRKGASKRGPHGRGRAGRRRRSLAGWLVKWTLVALIWSGVFAGALVAWYAYDLPEVESLSALTRQPAVTLLAADGTPFARFGEVHGGAVAVKDLPAHMPRAVLAIEDRRFYGHFGIDPIGVARAAIANLKAGRIVQGGSTITQQLAKNLFLGPERTVKRKVQELLLALWLERKFSKDQILTIYLNRVYFGAGTFGIAAAAERYFGKPARKLALNEAVMLAGLLKAPTRYSPTRNRGLAARRAGLVLDRMAALGFISKAQAGKAKRHPARPRRQQERFGRYFADWAFGQVKSYIGGAGRDLVVTTTLDVRLQRMAEAKLKAMLSGPAARAAARQAALVAMAPDGAVRTMVGGRDYGASQFNRVTQALRQPGSAFKPFVYLAGIEAGLKPETTVIDAPVTIGGWSPRNYDNRYRGRVSLSQALARSINTVAVRVQQKAGIENVIRAARRLGITSKLKREAGLALGASEVTLLELTAAFGAFANDGLGVWPYAVRQVRDERGKVLYRRSGSGPGRKIAPQALSHMNRMLAAVIAEGTGRAANIGRPAAGKTGTSEDFRDAWFIGYTADLVAGVWMGNDDGAPMKRVTGGGLPARLWREFMVEAHGNAPPGPLPGLERSAITNPRERLFGGSGKSEINRWRVARRGGPGDAYP